MTLHSVSSTVKEDVGQAVGHVVHDVGFGDALNVAIVAPQPRGKAGVVQVSDVMAFGGLHSVVIHHCKQLVLSLSDRHLVLGCGRKDVFGHFQSDGKVDIFQHLLTAS